MNIIWKILDHKNITVKEIYDILALRSEVFVVDQQCPYQDLDGRDLRSDTLHVVGYAENSDELIAYARILDLSEDSEKIKIGRVIVNPMMRGKKLAHQLLIFTINTIKQHHPTKLIALSAQAHLEDFYRGHGFLTVSTLYHVDNIPHIDMILSS